jgi:hypothetical protein
MIKVFLKTAILICLIASNSSSYQSLQEVYDEAPAYGDFDKYVELDPTIEYLGDLHVTGDIRTRIIGNGAIIYGIGNYIDISVRTGYAEISGCVIEGGGFGIYYSFGASGSIHNNTIFGANLYGIWTNYQDTVDGVYIWDNIITNCSYGIFCIENQRPAYYGFNTIWAIEIYRYAEQCLD